MRTSNPSSFPESVKKLLIDAHVQQTAVTDLNVYHVIELILGRR
jgi:hypothetical protein